MSKNTTTTIQQQRLQPYQEAMQKAIYGGLTDLMDQPIAQPDYEAAVAGLSPQQIQAINMAQQGVGSYEPLLTSAADMTTQAAQIAQQTGGRFDPSGVSEFMDPYEQEVVDRALADIRRQGDIERAGIGAQAARAGAFGGSRFALQEAELGRNILDRAGSTAANLRSAGYKAAMDQARQAFESQQARQQGSAQILGQAGTQFSNLAGQQQGLQQADISQLVGYGTQLQAQQQAELDAALRAQQAAATEPMQRLGFISDVFAAPPTSPTTFQQTQSPEASRTSQLLGLGVAALGATGGFNPFGGG